MMRPGLLHRMARGLAVRVATALSIAGALAAGAGDAHARGVAQTQAPGDIAVGAELEALTNVTLDRAEVARGSRVRVAALVHRRGRLSAVDVELADGHIVRVAAATIRDLFRVVTD